MNGVTCEKCGTHYETTQNVKNIRAIGLKLRGECGKCGNSIVINSIWRRTKTDKLAVPEES